MLDEPFREEISIVLAVGMEEEEHEGETELSGTEGVSAVSLA